MDKSNKKVLFTDLDGTLLNDQKEITKGNKDAIKTALSMGHSIVIATGRPLSSGIILAKELGLTLPGCYILAYNGGFLYDVNQDKLLSEARIPFPYVRHLFDEAAKRGLHCQTYTDTEILSEKNSENLKIYESRTNINAKVVPDVIQALEKPPGKVILVSFGQDPETLKDFQRDLEPWADGKLDSIFSTKEYLEYMPSGTSKGNGVLRLCKLLNIPIENTISAGDEENDLSMLKVTHVAAVMKNGSAKAKACGNYITTNDNNHDGVAEIIHRFMIKGTDVR